MADHPQHKNDTPRSSERGAITSLAKSALNQVAARPAANAPSPVALDVAIEQLHDAAIDTDSQRLNAVTDALLRDGLSPVAVSEICIPAVARRLGDQWCGDDLGFAGVTIGCARLTSTLRRLDQTYASDPPASAPHILILVGEDVYHTLGATVLSGIIRRSGYSTQLWIGADPATLAQHLAQSEFDAVFISASIGESLETIRRLVSTSQSACPTIPVIVGGTIIEYVGSAEEVKTLTGATLATNNPNEALELCEIAKNSAPSQTPPSSETSTSKGGR